MDASKYFQPARPSANVEFRLFYKLCGQVVHDYLEILAKTAFENGLSKDKIYTHTVAVQSVDVNTINTEFPPVWSAVNNYSTPGFTLCNESGARYDIKKLKRLIKKADPKKNEFAAVETYLLHHKTKKRFTLPPIKIAKNISL